jgi:hypothetical protein
MGAIFTKRFLFIVSCLFSFGLSSNAQIAGYTFSQNVTVGNYQPLTWYASNGFITGGAGAITNLATDAATYGSSITTGYSNSIALANPVNIPFGFPFNCRIYPTVQFYKTGYILVNNYGTAAPTGVNPITATTGVQAEGVIQAIGGLGGGLVASTAAGAVTTLSYARVSGTSFGADAMVFQWTGVSRGTAVTDDNINVQIWLFSTGEVKFIYGSCTPSLSSTTSSNMACGMRSIHFTDFHTRVVASGASWAASTGNIGSGTSASTLAVFNQTTFPVTHLMYSWVPNSCTPGTYQATPACMDFENTWQGTFQSVPNSAHWRSWPARGHLGWFRDDEVVANTNYILAPTAIPASSAGSPRFARLKTQGTNASSFKPWLSELDWYVDLSSCPTTSKTLTFKHYNASGSDSLVVLLSQDGGVTWTRLGSSGISSSWTTVSYTLGTNLSNTSIIRFRGHSPATTSDDLAIDDACISTGGTPPSVSISPVSPTYVCAAGQGNTSTTITASGAGTGGTYSWSPTIGLSATNIASVTASPTVSTIYTVTGIDASCNVSTATINVVVSPQYQIQATANPVNLCSGTNSTLTVNDTMYGSTTPPTGYCTTNLHTVASVCFDNVTIGSLNNSTSVCALPSYTDFTSSVGTVIMAGSLVPISVTPSAANTTIGCYIDYNRNGIFEASEHTQVGASGTTAGVAYTTNINVPYNATVGVTRMRIRSRSSATSTNWPSAACTSFNGGETEDYLVEIRRIPIGGITYSWNPTTFLSPTTGKNVTATSVTAATTTYTVTSTDLGNCTTTTTVTINVLPLNATINANPAIVCPGGSTILSANVTGGGQPYTYVWQGPNIAGTATITIGTNASVTVSPSLATTYTLTTSDACGNTTTTTLLVTVGSTPTLSVVNAAGGAIQICGSNTNNVSLKASGANTYVWSPVPNFINASGDSVNSNVTATTVYTVPGTRLYYNYFNYSFISTKFLISYKCSSSICL